MIFSNSDYYEKTQLPQLLFSRFGNGHDIARIPDFGRLNLNDLNCNTEECGESANILPRSQVFWSDDTLITKIFEFRLQAQMQIQREDRGNQVEEK